MDELGGLLQELAWKLVIKRKIILIIFNTKILIKKEVFLLIFLINYNFLAIKYSDCLPGYGGIICNPC